tara:strand:+ start:3408 stop:3875 length:468 start_codon:yes stop_codon:yes gene_type:complete
MKMKLTNDNLIDELNQLREKIINEDIKEIAMADEEIQYLVENAQRWGHYWGGADVLINTRLLKKHKEWLGNQPLVLSFQQTSPMRRVVITKYAVELTWLFIQLRELYYERIDSVSKYDFYGELAQKAIDVVNETDNKCSVEKLLFEVLRTSKIYI